MKPSIELFKEKAKSLEKRFLNRWKRQGFYKTVLGKKNFFTKVDRHYLYFCTEGEGKRLLKIARNKVREAISYLHFKRTSIRKELEKFSKYSSALFGILETIFGSLVKKQRCPSGLVRLTLKGTRFFPSGCCRKGDLELIKASGGKFVMLSYYDIHDNSTWLSHLVRLNLYAIIDSGAFSFYRTKGQQKETDYYPLVDVPEIPLIDRYLSFINQYKDYPNVIGFFNLDVIGDPVKTKENYAYIKERTDAVIVPVWQISDTFTSLDDLVADGHDLIGVGGTVPLLQAGKKLEVDKIFKEVFKCYPDNVNFHWLGGANDLLLKYDFFSSDATTWLNPRKYGYEHLLSANLEEWSSTTLWPTKERMKQHLRMFLGLEEVEETALLF